ncbi:sensor histidine kinase [Cohnella hashimotonis]|uniref:histidine kinase n=1 Tax=Cohnella hashimotonis TaxID=2826895 RepID=A0ABT6TVU6_9BACL|nr:sensor histidine kinase [Cohnella hashimotonis]MDI4649947.1 sensor histidine kinase [Cohnella hashimotonis]
MRIRLGFHFYRNMRIRNKLSLLIALIVALSFSATLLVQQYAFSIYDSQIYTKSSQVLNLSSSAIEAELKRIRQISYNVTADGQVQSLLKKIANPDTSDYDRLLLRRDLVDRLLNYTGTEPYLLSIQLYDALGHENAAGNVKALNDAKIADLLSRSDQAEGEQVMLYPDESDSALITARKVRSYEGTDFSLKRLGMLVIRINIERIVRENAPAEGELLIRSGPDIVYPVHPAFADVGLVEKESRSGSGYFVGSFGGERYFVSHIESGNSGWMYFNLTPFNQIFERIIFIKELVVFVFVGLLVVVIAWGFRFSRSLTRPIDDLIARMRLAERGNFEEANLESIDTASVPRDEVGLLHRSFRIMIERINTLITENFKSRLLVKETEFKALQAQINPHFLYNTLESINWMAKINRQPQISQMVEALGFLLRNSISLGDPLIPLREELGLVESYVTIQKYRFEERLEFETDIPETLLGRTIPKLTLQPLLENAVNYAVEPSMSPCRIVIRARESTAEGLLLLTVEDSGPGMDPRMLERLRSGEARGQGRGIGLLNIDERIKIAFGEVYGVRVESEPGRGTRVSLALPADDART